MGSGGGAATGTRKNLGETLVEVVITVVIIGITVTALISGLATAATSGAAHRESVSADAVMRNLAESAKAASDSCVLGGRYTITYVPPTGYTTSVSPGGGVCPPPSSTTLLQLQVTTPSGAHQTMQVRVRTP